MSKPPDRDDVAQTVSNETAAGEASSPERYDLFTFKTDKHGAQHVEQRGEYALQKIFGSKSPALNEGLFIQCYAGLTDQEISDGGEDRRGFMAAIIREIAPRDAIEQML